VEDQALAGQGLGLIKSHSLQSEKKGARPGAFSFSLSPVTGRVSVVAVAPPGTIFADLARPIIGPDHAAVAMPVAIVCRIAVIGRRNIEASMEVAPVMEEGPVVGVTVSVAITAAIDTGCTKTATPKDGRCAEAAPVDRHPTAPEPAAAKRRAAASKSAASKATASAAAKNAATTATAAVPDFGRQPIGCVLRSRSRAGTCK